MCSCRKPQPSGTTLSSPCSCGAGIVRPTGANRSSTLGTFELPQLDINNKRPERALFLPTEARRQWAFVPGSTTDHRYQSEPVVEQERDELHPTANEQEDAITNITSTQVDTVTERSSFEETGHSHTIVAATGGGNGDIGGKSCRDEDVEERGAKGEGLKRRRERSRRQQERQQRQHGANRAGENEGGPQSPDSLR